jgi:hypothetical protein
MNQALTAVDPQQSVFAETLAALRNRSRNPAA